MGKGSMAKTSAPSAGKSPKLSTPCSKTKSAPPKKG
jgi:hypothetical protein